MHSDKDKWPLQGVELQEKDKEGKHIGRQNKIPRMRDIWKL